MSRYQDTAHALALGMADMGGAGFVYHPPGHGDSTGDIRKASVPRLVEAAVDAFREARSRVPHVPWDLAGLRLGAAVACLATLHVPASRLVLLQPETDPPVFFAAMKRSAARGALGGPGAERAPFGYPLGAEVVAGDPGLDVAGALRSFGDRGLIVHHDLSGPPAVAPPGFQVEVVPGRWQPRLRLNEPLVGAALAWMKGVGSRP